MEVLFPVRRYGSLVRNYEAFLTDLAWNIVVTFPVVFFFLKETKQVSLEDIDLLFGERALGTLPNDLHKEMIAEHHEVQASPFVGDTPIASATPVASDGEAPVAEDGVRREKVADEKVRV